MQILLGTQHGIIDQLYVHLQHGDLMAWGKKLETAGKTNANELLNSNGKMNIANICNLLNHEET